MFRKLSEALYGVYATATFAVVVLLVFCPLLIVTPGLLRRRAVGRFGVRAWAACSFIPFRIRGVENLPENSCIVVCNHASYLDGILLTAALPVRFTFLVQHGAAGWPYIGFVLKRMKVMFVNRGSARAAALVTRELLDRSRAGESFAIFPEGTFVRADGLLPFQTGAFLIAARAGIPVVPSTICGTRHMLGQHQKLLRRAPVEIEFHRPVIPAADAGYSRNAVGTLRDAARAIMESALHGRADAAIDEGSSVDARGRHG